MLKSVGKGFMWFSRKLAIPLTAAGGFLTLFVGNVANATVLRNPDAGIVDIGKSWLGFTQDPNSILALDESQLVDPDSVLTGVDGLVAGLGGVIDG